MDRWGNLNMQQKAQLLGIYASKGYTDLASIINHYNTFQAGGRLTFEQWKSQMQSKYPDIEMDNTKAGYDYNRYFNDNYDDAIRQLSALRHFPDTYKLPNHKTFSNESIYSRGPMMGGRWVNDSTFSPSIINRQQYPDVYKEDRPYTEREIYGNKYQQGSRLYQKGGPTGNKSDWAKAHEVELALQQLGWDNPNNKLHSDYAAKDDEGYMAGYRLKPVTIVAEHPIRKWDKTVNLQDPNFNDLYQHYLNREEAGKKYMFWAAPAAMSPLIPIAGPTVMNIMSTPLVDAIFTADAVRNLPTALGDIRDNFNEGKIGKGLLQTGETALDLLGAGKLGKGFSKAWQKTFNLDNNLGFAQKLPRFGKTGARYSKELQTEIKVLQTEREAKLKQLIRESPIGLSHNLSDVDLLKTLKYNGKSASPSLALSRFEEDGLIHANDAYASNGEAITLYFEPSILDKNGLYWTGDGFWPTYSQAIPRAKSTSLEDILAAKRQMYQEDLNNPSIWLDKPVSQQEAFESARRHLGSYAEYTPNDIFDLGLAKYAITKSKDPIILQWFKDRGISTDLNAFINDLSIRFNRGGKLD